MKTGHTPSRSVEQYWQNADIPWFTLADVWQLRDGRQVYLGETANRISRIGLDNSAAELLPAGTVVLSRTASVGFSGIMPQRMATSQDFWNWICGPELLPEFLNYQFKTMQAELKALNVGSTHQTIYQKDAAGLQILVPPVEEQRAIADYLDRETAQIDTLIAKQEELITTLRERRSVVVDQALSRGLDGGSELRDTGDPFLPLLPVGWRVTQTRRLLRDGPTNGMSPEISGVGDLKSLSLAAVRDGRVRLGERETKLVDGGAVPKRDELRLQSGDILIVRGNGNRDLVGRAGLVGPEFDSVESIYPDLLIRVRTNSTMLPEFLVRAFNSSATRTQIAARARTAVGTYKISAGDVRSIVLPTPPLAEQRKITTHLDEQTAKIDALIAKTERFIELSKERRTALITAAVTGQIDVRASA